MIKKLTLFVTDDCNLKCDYCYIYLKNHYLDYYTFINIINKGWDEVTLTGGEALLHPYIWSMIEEIHKTNTKIRLLSNGFLLTEETILRLKQYDVTIYVTYQKDRRHILKNIELAVTYGLKVGINHVLTRKDRYSLKSLPRKIDSICLIYPTDYGNANVPIYDFDVWHELIAQALDDYEEFRDIIMYEPAFIYEEERKYLTLSCIESDCVTINVFGEQVKCCLLLNKKECVFEGLNECPLMKEHRKLEKPGIMAICPLLLKKYGDNKIW